MAAEVRLDTDRLQQMAQHVGSQVSAGLNCILSNLGDKLGLYSTIKASGAVSSDELADSTGLHERWIREWLRQQACVGQLDYDVETDRFSISPEAAAILCEADHPMYFASGFNAVNVLQNAGRRLPEIFRSGIGLSFDDHGADCACGIERLNNYVPRYTLVQEIIPMVLGLDQRLLSGIRVADVGCGSGIALREMAKAYPHSSFVGYEISEHALGRAADNLAEAGVENVQLCNAAANPLPEDHSYDLITTFDVIHDAPFPRELIHQIHRALSPDGVWLCSDIRSFPSFGENLENNPSAQIMYGFSLLVCLSSAMSQPGAEGLGTLGFNEPVARQMAKECGFRRFRTLEYETAVNSYYDIRP